jgi:hypothetical protein
MPDPIPIAAIAEAGGVGVVVATLTTLVAAAGFAGAAIFVVVSTGLFTAQAVNKKICASAKAIGFMRLWWVMFKTCIALLSSQLLNLSLMIMPNYVASSYVIKR